MSDLLKARTQCILPSLIPALIIPCLGALFYINLLSGTSIGKACYIATKVFILLWPLVATFLIERPRAHSRRRIDWAKHLSALPLGLLLGLAMSILMLIAYKYTFIGRIVQQSAPAIRSEAADLGIAQHFLLFGIFLAVGHSLLEEYYWRWYVFGRLNMLIRPVLAYPLAALAFAAHHYIILAGFLPTALTFALGTCVAVAGVIWSWLYRRQRTIVGCWAAHLLADGVIIYIGYQLIQ